MALIVEFELRTPVLESVEEATARLRLEEEYSTDSGALKLLFWAVGDEFESLRTALDADENVVEYSLLEEATDRRLYSAVVTDDAATKLTYPVAVEHDVVILEAIVTDTTFVRARVPDRETLRSYREVCRERGIDLLLQRIYREEAGSGGQYGVSDAQREALLAALEAGYFEVPRATTLSDLAAELDISDQALSARLRRGQANLLAQTLAEDPTSFEGLDGQ